MGTRADYYVGRGPNAEWLGSTAWDGYPEKPGLRESAPAVLDARTEDEFRKAVADMLAKRDDATTPDQGWPWPWNDSATTDYAYAFDGDKVYYTIGYQPEYWWPADTPAPAEDADDYPEILKTLTVAVHPDMSARKAVTLGDRSGTIVLVG